MSSTRNAAASLVLLSALCIMSVAAARPTVIITVDVESRSGLPLPDQVDPTCTDGSRCGLMQIARMLEQRHLAGTFFLNVYEFKAWGKPALRDIALDLQRHGHDVALHTHPQWAYDEKRPNMYDYSLEDQTKIIADGAALLTEWTGLPVVAHRAGTYSADLNTLKALERNNIHVDSSWFLEHDNSRLSGLGLGNNVPSRTETVYEVPVTVYLREEFPAILSGIAPPLVSVRKVDANWFRSESEAIAVIDALSNTDLPYLIFFLHSYSLISENSTQGSLVLDDRSNRIFSAMLDQISKKHLPVTTFRKLAPTQATVPLTGKDVVPQVTVAVPVSSYIAHAIHNMGTAHASPQAIVFLLTIAAGLLAVAILAGAAVRRYRGRAPT